MKTLRTAIFWACLAIGACVHAASQRVLAPDTVRDAFEHHRSGQEITVQGTVIRMLADDRDGSRHQRFIIRADNGPSLLVAHNIDLAPRLNGLKAGDRLTLVGEYEWNAQGGLMHWTHRDPSRRHRPGYIEWKGQRYQ